MASDRPDARDGALMDFRLRADGVNVLAKAYDASGKEIPVPARIAFFPQFYSAFEQVRIGTIEVLSIKGDEKKSVFRSAVDVSGRTGQVRLPRIEEQSVVIPLFMTEQRVVRTAEVVETK
jgi:hypothetical protein